MAVCQCVTLRGNPGLCDVDHLLSCLSTDGNSRISSIRATADRVREDKLIQKKNNSEREAGDIREQNYIDSRLSRGGKTNQSYRVQRLPNIQRSLSAERKEESKHYFRFFLFDSDFSLEIIGIVET